VKRGASSPRASRVEAPADLNGRRDAPASPLFDCNAYWMTLAPEGVAVSVMLLSEAVLDCQIVPVVFVPK
jgi:hypothetical protein